MPDAKKEKIRQFVNDPDMERAVHGALLRFFLKAPKERDVQFLAASWVAKEIFDEGWKDLLRLKNDSEKREKPISNLAL